MTGFLLVVAAYFSFFSQGAYAIPSDFGPAPGAMRVDAPPLVRVRSLQSFIAPFGAYQLIFQGERSAILGLNGSVAEAYSTIDLSRPYCALELNLEMDRRSVSLPAWVDFRISRRSADSPHAGDLPSRYPWDREEHWILTPDWDSVRNLPIERIVCVNAPHFAGVRAALAERLDFFVPFDLETFTQRGRDFSDLHSNTFFSSREDLFSYAFVRLGSRRSVIPLPTLEIDTLFVETERFARLDGEEAGNSFYLMHRLTLSRTTDVCRSEEERLFSARRVSRCQVKVEYSVMIRSEFFRQFRPALPLSEEVRERFHIGVAGPLLEIFPEGSPLTVMEIEQAARCGDSEEQCLMSAVRMAVLKMTTSIALFGADRALANREIRLPPSQAIVRGSQDPELLMNIARNSVSARDEIGVEIFPEALEAVYDLRRARKVTRAQNGSSGR